MSYRISATKNNRSYDLDDCESDVETLDEAREWAAARIRDLAESERSGMRVWIDELCESGQIRKVENVLVPE